MTLSSSVASAPKITVLMAVHNGGKFLREAINSILNQTYSDFDFLIVNDASTDDTLDIVNSYRDNRIRLLHNQRNIGLAASLNLGIDRARGEYIARMDCDDISLPKRLERQVKYLDSNPDICVCGTWAEVIDDQGAKVRDRPMPTGRALQLRLWLTSPVIHASAMIRRHQLGNTRYDPSLACAQDFDLWFKLRKKCKLDNIPEVLLKYRVHHDNISQQRKVEQLKNSYTIFINHTAIESVSYDEYLSLIYCSFKLTPIQHFLLTLKLSKLAKKRYIYLLRDSLIYSKLWFRNADRNHKHL